MIGSPVVGAWIAQVVFWAFIAMGLRAGGLNRRTAAIFVTLWLAGAFGLPRIAWWTGSLVISWVAALDVALVLIVMKSDVRFT